MLQDIIALTIVFMAFAYTLYSVVKSFTVKSKSNGCGGGCSCPAKKEFKSILAKDLKLHNNAINLP